MDENKLYSISLQEVASILGISPVKNYIVTSQVKRNTSNSKIPFRADAIAVFICTKGEMEVVINLQKYHITAHTVIVNLPEKILFVNYISDDFEGYTLIIEKVFMGKLFIELQEMYPFYFCIHKNPCLRVSEKEMSKLTGFFRLLEDVTEGPESKQKEKIVTGCIVSLLYQLYEIYDMYCTGKSFPASRSKESYFQNFMELVSIHFRKERNVGFYAEKLCITSSYLSDIVKQYSGKSPLKWIDNYTLMEAKILLRLSSESVQQIAYYLNFSNQSSFGKYFKKHTGLSPKHYRDRKEI